MSFLICSLTTAMISSWELHWSVDTAWPNIYMSGRLLAEDGAHLPRGKVEDLPAACILSNHESSRLCNQGLSSIQGSLIARVEPLADLMWASAQSPPKRMSLLETRPLKSSEAMGILD